MCLRPLALGILLQVAAAGAAFELVPQSSLTKLRPEVQPTRAEPRITLAAARNEREAFQVAVVAGPDSVSSVTVAATSLIHADRSFRIGPEQIEVRLVGYTPIEQPSWRGARQTGRWPDPPSG